MVGGSRSPSFSCLTYLCRLRRTPPTQRFSLDSKSKHDLVKFDFETLIRGTRRSATMKSANALSTSHCSLRRLSGSFLLSYLCRRFYSSYPCAGISNHSHLGSKLELARSPLDPQTSNLFLPQSQRNHQRSEKITLSTTRCSSLDIDTLANTYVHMKMCYL